jgi:hypothetical protein
MRSSLPFQSYLHLLNLPKLLFTERQLGSFNQKKKIPIGGSSRGGVGRASKGDQQQGGGRVGKDRAGGVKGGVFSFSFSFFWVLPPFLGGG